MEHHPPIPLRPIRCIRTSQSTIRNDQSNNNIELIRAVTQQVKERVTNHVQTIVNVSNTEADLIENQSIIAESISRNKHNYIIQRQQQQNLEDKTAGESTEVESSMRPNSQGSRVVAWYRKYNHTNLPERKKRVIEINKENHRLVNRIANIKPHHEIRNVIKTTQDVIVQPNKTTSSKYLINQYPHMSLLLPIQGKDKEFRPIAKERELSPVTIATTRCSTEIFRRTNTSRFPLNFESAQKSSLFTERRSSEYVPIKDFLKFSNQTQIIPLPQLQQHSLDHFPISSCELQTTPTNTFQALRDVNADLFLKTKDKHKQKFHELFLSRQHSKLKRNQSHRVLGMHDKKFVDSDDMTRIQATHIPKIPTMIISAVQKDKQQYPKWVEKRNYN